MTGWITYGCVLLVLLFGGCSGTQQLRPYDERMNTQADAAPLLVVGLAENDERIGEPVTSRHGAMQLHRITVHVENVLKGDAPQRTIPVYYFSYAGPSYGSEPLIFGREPSRRIFWLRMDGGRHRIACDGFNCALDIMSGAHPGVTMTPGESIDRVIAELLLTRGEGPIDDHQFARQLDRGVPDRGDEDYVVEKLGHLAVTEANETKYAAC